MRRTTHSVSLGVAIVCGSLLAGEAQAAVVVPGQTATATLTPSVIPIALGYDFLASKLYAVAIQQPGNAHVFGSINPATGAFTPIPSGTALNVGALVGGTVFAIQAGNPLIKANPLALFMRSDGLVTVDLANANLTVAPSPQPSYPAALAADPQTAVLFGRGSSGVLGISPGTGIENIVAPYNFGGGLLGIVSTVDSYHGIFYVEEQSGSTTYLDQITESTGQVGKKVLLKAPVFSLGFDASDGSQSGTLYGITECCSGSLPASNQLVRIDPGSGAETPIATVGGKTFGFPGGVSGTLDGNDAFFSTYLTSQLVTADTTVDRSWYVESPIGEAMSSLDAWMSRAGQAMGLRDAALTAPRVVNAILDFGQPGQNAKGTYGVVGFKGSQFLSMSAVSDAVVAFLEGWAKGVGTTNTSLRVVVGTNNYGSGLTKQHGQAWAVMIAGVMKVLASEPYASRVAVIGGIDIEMLYGPPTAVTNWAKGYGSKAYADFGDAQGCPSKCAGGWSAANVISLGGNAFFPEIYSAGGGNAKSWAGLSAVAKKTPGLAAPLPIVAPLSQLTACQQRGSCGTTTATRTDNAPMASWTQLTQALIMTVGATGAVMAPATNIEHRVPK